MGDEVLGMFDEISNESLRAADVPSANASWPEMFTFALSFDGYEKLGGTGPCGELANQTVEYFEKHGRLPGDHDLTMLRACLFFEQRRWHHFGDAPDSDGRKYWVALLDSIRQRAIQ